jgi:hypothetical protein
LFAVMSLGGITNFIVLHQMSNFQLYHGEVQQISLIPP